MPGMGRRLRTTLEQYNQQRTAERLRREIALWDHNDADVLRDLLVAFTNVRDALERDRVYTTDIDGSSLPSEPFPAGFDTTGYWALDRSGYAVRGVSWEDHELDVVKI